MFAAVEFLGRGGSIEVSVVPKLWLTDNDAYCYWPRSAKNNAVFLELVKQQALYQKGWSKHKVHKVLRTSEHYQDIEDYACDLIDGGTTDDAGKALEVIRKPIIDEENGGSDNSAVEKENIDPQDDDHRKPKKHHQKKGKGIKRTRRNNSSSLESDDSTQSSFPQNSESTANSDEDSSFADGRHKSKRPKKQKLDTRRKVDEMSHDNSVFSQVRNSGSTVSRKNYSDDRVDPSARQVEFVSQKSKKVNNESPAATKGSVSNKNGQERQESVEPNCQRSATPQSLRSDGTARDKQESGKSNRQLICTTPSSRNNSLPCRVFQASPETHRKIFGSGSSRRDDINDDLWFRRKVLDYLEGSKTLFEQICVVLTQLLQTTQANLMGTEKPKELPDLPIADVHTFELFDKMLVDPVIKGYMKNRLMSIGGDTVRSVAMGMMRGVIADVLATQYNWAGHKDKKKFETTNLQGVICESTKQFLRKKIKATDKDIKDAMKDWLKQASNRIKGRTKSSLPNAS